MYAWKCWRDSRTTFTGIIGMLIIFLAVVSFGFRGMPHPYGIIHQPTFELHTLRRFCLMPFIVAFASVGIPTNDFMLTRPYPRSRMIWIAFAVSMIKIAVICLLVGLVGLVLSSRSLAIYAGPSFTSAIALTMLEAWIAAGILRGFFVLITVTSSRRRPVYLGIALSLLPFYWYFLAIYPAMEHWTPWLPVPVPDVLTGSGFSFDYVPGLFQGLLLRALCLLLLTFIAQKILEQREVA